MKVSVALETYLHNEVSQKITQLVRGIGEDWVIDSGTMTIRTKTGAADHAFTVKAVYDFLKEQWNIETN